MIRAFFDRLPEESKCVGRLLAYYADLEVALMVCAYTIRGPDDLDSAVKIMYRMRGEKRRIDMADAFARQHYERAGLGTEFSMAIGSMHWCRQIRNQYAHCIWHDLGEPTMTFTDLEQVAKEHAPIVTLWNLPKYRVDLKLLWEQEAYFEYLDSLFVWLTEEARLLHRLVAGNTYKKPKELTRPLLHI